MVIGRVIIRVTPFRALITLLITYLLSPLPLHVNPLKAQALAPAAPTVEARKLEHGFRRISARIPYTVR